MFKDQVLLISVLGLPLFEFRPEFVVLPRNILVLNLPSSHRDVVKFAVHYPIFYSYDLFT